MSDVTENYTYMKATDYLWGCVSDEEVEVRTHSKDKCAGERCCIHNPSDHHMREWPKVMRMDKLALIERTCPHGVGHPDPDSLNYFKSEGCEWVGIHGCDGCCVPPG